MALTIQKIRSVIRKAGFPAMKSTSTMVRGWRNYSSGYTVRPQEDGFRVHWDGMSHWNTAEKNQAIRLEKLTAMQLALLNQGIQSEVKKDDWNHFVMVPLQ